MPKFLACALAALWISFATALIAQPLAPDDPFGAQLPGDPNDFDPFADEPAGDPIQDNRPAPPSRAVVSDGPTMPPAISSAEAAVEALNNRIDLHFVETPLTDVVETLREVTNENNEIDSRALEEIGF
jgi:hypothetical protein